MAHDWRVRKRLHLLFIIAHVAVEAVRVELRRPRRVVGYAPRSRVMVYAVLAVLGDADRRRRREADRVARRIG
jgi:hypothetical protein